MNWYYIDGPRRVGPLNETEWAELVRTGVIRPETLVWHEGRDNNWVPYDRLTPEDSETEPPELPEEAAEAFEDPAAFAARVVDLDYTVDVQHCIARAWEVYKSDLWMLVGSAFLILALVGAGSMLPILEIAIPMLLRGVLFGGLFIVFLRIMRGEPSHPADLFSGFERELLKPLALETLVTFGVSQLCFAPAMIAMKMKGITLQNYEATLAADPQTALVLLLVFLACSIPAVYFAFCWMFAIPLIVDKRMPFWPAMQLSRRKVLQHPWRIGVLSVAAGIVGAVGVFGFIIGIIFTLPLNFLVMLFLYEDIFNQPQPRKSAEAETE